jgi:MFS family permease
MWKGIRPLPRPLDLSAYRIIQEGLTNVRKHARATRADVTVRLDRCHAHVELAADLGVGLAEPDRTATSRFFFNTLYIQRVLGYGPLEAGLAFLPFTAGIMVSAGLASKFSPRVGVRPVAIAGMTVTIAGMALLTQIAADGTYVKDVLPGLVLTSLGLGCVFVPLTLIATTGLDDEDQGLASGLFNTSQQIGGALGLAILASFAASETSSATGVSEQEALVQGFHVAFAGGAAFVGVALLGFLAMVRRRDVARIEAEAAASASAA